MSTENKIFFFIVFGILAVGLGPFFILMPLISWWDAPPSPDYVYEVTVDLRVEGQDISPSRKIRCESYTRSSRGSPRNVRWKPSIKAFGEILPSGNAVFIEVPAICPNENERNPKPVFPEDFVPVVGWTDDPENLTSFEAHVSPRRLQEGNGRIQVTGFHVEELSKWTWTDDTDQFDFFGTEYSSRQRHKTNSYLRASLRVLSWRGSNSGRLVRGMQTWANVTAGGYFLSQIDEKAWKANEITRNALEAENPPVVLKRGDWEDSVIDQYSPLINFERDKLSGPVRQIDRFLGLAKKTIDFSKIVPFRRIGEHWRPDPTSPGVLVYYPYITPVLPDWTVSLEIEEHIFTWPPHRFRGLDNKKVYPLIIAFPDRDHLYQVSWQSAKFPPKKNRR